MGFPGVSVVKNPLANAGDAGDAGSIPGLGRFPGGGHGDLLHLFLPGEFLQQRSLVGCSPWVCKESDMTEHTRGTICRYAVAV